MQPSPAVAPSPSPEPSAAQWFTDEVHRHEPQLRSYLRGRFPAVSDVDDVVQEAYVRLWRTRATRRIRCAKALLFTIARHLALDVVRKRNSIRAVAGGDLAALPVIEESPNAAEALCYEEKVCVLADALAALPAACREVVVLRKLKSLSQKEVAARLGLSERTVENQLARGIKRCEQILRRRGVSDAFLR